MTFQDVLHELEEANISVNACWMAYEKQMLISLERNLTLRVTELVIDVYENPFRKEEYVYFVFEMFQSDDVLYWPDLDGRFDKLTNGLTVSSANGSELRESEFGQLKKIIKRMLLS